MLYFVFSVARQTAKHCVEEHRQHLRQRTTNYRTQLPNPVNEIDADTADEFGLLAKEDDSLMFIQLTVFLSSEKITVLIFQLSRRSRKCICRQLHVLFYRAFMKREYAIGGPINPATVKSILLLYRVAFLFYIFHRPTRLD
ncbi:MAG: hypothetical protein LBN39_12245 [Planctomycetaceae bacterium]|nr:hypothetical protein [Planctomycetaceae bacterium]